MRKIAVLLVLGMCSLGLTAGLAWAQSSGSFTYGSNAAKEHCVLNNDNTGTISGGQTCAGGFPAASCTDNKDCPSGEFCENTSGGTGAGECVFSAGSTCTTDADCTPSNPTCFIQGTATSGTCVNTNTGNNLCIGSFLAGIKTNNGSGNVFVVTPSAVIGLLTDAKINQNQESSSALAGVDFSVSVTPQSGQANPTITPSYPVTYDSRFVQISSNLFDAIGSACTTTGCYFSFNESTVSAHSFQWIASGLSSGNYDVGVSWTSSLGDFGIANSMTCVGPVNLTVEQNKVFNFNTVTLVGN